MSTDSDNPRWRVGRSLGRTIYLQRGAVPAKGDTFVGIMDDPAMARLIVDTLNACGIEPPDECGA